jgi:hypothetical protein
MKYISLGDACSVKYNLDKYKGGSETLFFDWLMTSINSVINILSCDNIKDILYFENIIKDITNSSSTHAKISIKSLDYFCSIHDVPTNHTDKDIFDFIDKYTRRFNRIIEYVKSNEDIVFIRNGYINNNEAEKFIEAIKKINPYCNFTLVIIHNNKENNTEILKQPNLLHLKLNIDLPEHYDWTKQYLNWDKIFLDIENNI